MKVEDPHHPLNASFRGKDFLIKDEIYRIRQINLRKNARVLLGLDMKAEQNLKASGVRYSDRDMAISWIKSYGKGRVFYCSLGHNDSVYTMPAVLQHYLDGIQYALGDFEVDATPLPFDPMTFFRQDTLNAVLQRISTYQYGHSLSAFQDLNEFIRGVDDLPQARVKIKEAFLELLKGNATTAGKKAVAMKLAVVGEDESIPILTTLISDTALGETALYALEGIPERALMRYCIRQPSPIRAGNVSPQSMRWETGELRRPQEISGDL